MIMDKYQNTQASLADLVPIALTQDSQATSTEEQSVDITKRKIPLKQNQTSTEVRTQTTTKEIKGDYRREINLRACQGKTLQVSTALKMDQQQGKEGGVN